MSSSLNSLLSKVKATSVRPLFGLENASTKAYARAATLSQPNEYLAHLDQQNRTILMTLDDSMDVESAISLLSNDSNVEYVEPNYLYRPNANKSK